MSIPVELPDLAAAIAEYGFAYLLTVNDTGRSHAVAVTPRFEEGVLVTPVGRGTARNATARPAVALVYPPVEVGGYSLIVDVVATVDPAGDEPVVHLRPERAVLHRPAPPGESAADGCGADCRPVPLGG